MDSYKSDSGLITKSALQCYMNGSYNDSHSPLYRAKDFKVEDHSLRQWHYDFGGIEISRKNINMGIFFLNIWIVLEPNPAHKDDLLV